MGMAGGEEQMDGPASCDEKIFVSVRLRPLNERELARNEVSDWECIDDNTIIYRNNLSISERSMYPAAYTFDRVFGCKCSTRQVYEEGAKRVALSVVSGINSSLFAYGQTSSGKTYTMSGITEYTVADIYDYIERHKEREFVLKFSAMEIYNESVRDLLSADSTPLRLLDDPERGTVVERLTEVTLKDWNHFKELLSVCEAQRQIGETALNETSSRSHQILRLTIDSSAREFLGCDKSSTLTATVNFVDLAGSERASQSLSAGTRLKEGCHINRSLLTLGTVIRKLSKGRNGHIPFRDSKLTRILQPSLGGNARTAIICTMSPARLHVEQSRNTLLFASCAKEVTTNAQVNVVMSDKALVKHLQRELARLESELRGSGLNSVASDFAALLREKDLEIEKLKKEVKELTLQCDLARSQLQNQLHVVEDARPPEVKEDDKYPRLRVQSSWDQEYPTLVTPNEDSTSATPAFKDFHCLEIGVASFDASQYSDGHSCSSCSRTEQQVIQLLEPIENFPYPTSSPRQSTSSAESRMQEGIQEQIDLNQDDLCREVRCIEMEDLGPSNNVASNTPGINSDRMSAEENSGTSPISVANFKTAERDLASPKSPPMTEDKDLNSVHQTSVNTSGKSSSWVMKADIISSPRNLMLRRSQSCKESLTTNLSLQWSNRMEKNGRTPPDEVLKEFTGRPDGFQKKAITLKFDDDPHIKDLSRNGSHKTNVSTSGNELNAQDMTSSFDKDIIISTSAADGELRADLQHEEAAEDKVQKTSLKHNAIAKSVRDIGLDPIDLPQSPLTWPLEFKKLQREIIELWHVCNISLVHRSHFFFLFKGDPSDSIYMEVEFRRLSFVKEKSSGGHQTLADASSVKALQHERRMLSRRMKRLPDQDRENLYLKWGIGLNTKHRKLQLAHRLWTDKKDIEHITASATLVGRLVGFINPDYAFKEMYGFSFAPRALPASKKFYHSLRLRHRMKALL